MKQLLTILCLVLLVSCSNEVPSDKLVERGDITYGVNSEKPFTGTSVEYYLDTIIKDEFEDRVLWKRTTYKDGVLDGLNESFHPNGQLKENRNYKNGKMNGSQEDFYENGQLKNIYSFKNGTQEGLREQFWDNGQVMIRTNYLNDKEQGLMEGFRQDGTLKLKGEYDQGIRLSLQEFSTEGVLLTNLTDKDRKETEQETYHGNGQLWTRGNFKNGKEEGLHETYNENGQLSQKQHYKN